MAFDCKWDGGLWIARGNRWLGEPPADLAWEPFAGRDFVAATARADGAPYDFMQWMQAVDSEPRTADYGEFTMAVGRFAADDGSRAVGGAFTVDAAPGAGPAGGAIPALDLECIEKFSIWKCGDQRRFTWWKIRDGQEWPGVFPGQVKTAAGYEQDDRDRAAVLAGEPPADEVRTERELTLPGFGGAA